MMSSYPEHDKLRAVRDETGPAGEFLEWLSSQGIRLMTWREDLTDEWPTDPECHVKLDLENQRPCDQARHIDGDTGTAWWRRHCLHWQDPERETEGAATQGQCCRCGKGLTYVVTAKSWVHETRDITQLLADWADIDQNKLEAEKRQIIADARRMNEQS